MTYGCSLTKFKIPTYADILGLNYKVDNFGMPGSGNDRIFYNVMKSFKNKFDHMKESDLIIVQWSHPLRWDYQIKPNEWISNKGRTKVKDYWSDSYEYEKSINHMITVKHTLDTLPAKKVYMSFEDHNLPFIDIPGLFPKYEGNYKFYIDKQLKHDPHPTVFQQFEITKEICKLANIPINIDRSILKKSDTQIRTQKDYKKYKL